VAVPAVDGLNPHHSYPLHRLTRERSDGRVLATHPKPPAGRGKRLLVPAPPAQDRGPRRQDLSPRHSGLDTGIAPTDGVRGDPRIKSGDDEEGAVGPATGFSDRALILIPMRPAPA
jgi:hypothetical protein